MNLSQLYYFRELANVKSFKKAAETLFVSVPTLSIAIKKLETELGSELLIRKHSSIELTDDGRELYACLQHSLTNIDRHVDAIKTHARKRNSMLRIGIVFSLQQRIWSSLLNDFWITQHRNPDNIIKQSTTQQLLAALKNDEVDVIIAGTMEQDDTVEKFPLWTSSALVAVNKKNPLASRASVTFDDIRSHKLITYEADSPLGPESKRLAQEFSLDPDYAFANEPSICSNVASRPEIIGIICDSWMAYSFPDVKIIPLADAPTDFHRFWLIHRANIPETQKLLNDFIRFAKRFDHKPYL